MTETANRIIRHVCFEKELFEKLEKARGIATRSAFINMVLKERLRQQETHVIETEESEEYKAFKEILLNKDSGLSFLERLKQFKEQYEKAKARQEGADLP